MDSGRIQTGHAAAVGAGHAVHDTFQAFLPPLLPVLIRKLSMSKTDAGLLTMLMQIPSLIQPVIGHAADRENLRYLVALAPLVAGVLMTPLGIVPRYGLLIPLVVLAGLNSAAIHAVGPVTVSRMSGGSLGQAMGLWMFAGELGRTVGPLAVVSVVNLAGVHRLPWLTLLGLVTSGVLLVRLRGVSTTNASETDPAPLRSVLRGKGQLIAIVLGIIVSRAFLTSALGVYLPTFLAERGTGIWLAGASLTVYEVPGLAGAVIGGWASDHLGRRNVLLVSMGSAPLLTFAFLLSDGWLRFALLLPLGFATLSTAPVVMALILETFPDNRALANGLYMAFMFGMRALAVVILGIVADAFDLWWALAVSAGIMALGAPLVHWLPKPSDGPNGRG